MKPRDERTIYFCPRFHVNFYHSYRGDTADEQGFGKDIRIIRGILDDLEKLETEGISVHCAWDFDNVFSLGHIIPRHAPDILNRIKDRVATGRDEIHLMSWNNGLLSAHTPEEFKLAVPSYGDRSISLHLMVPEGRTYQVILASQNGSLRVENLKGTALELRTINGSTELRSVKAQSLVGKIGNGSCEMDGVEAESIRHTLGNGSYRLSVAAPAVDLTTTNGTVNVRVTNLQGRADYRLRTTNGAIKVSLPSRVDLGVSLDLKTSVGRVAAELDSLEITKHERQGGGALLTAHSSDYQSFADQLHLEARCVSGSITVSSGSN